MRYFNFDRYIAVCFPFFRLRHNLKARYYIVPILLFAPLYNLPRFFEFETVKDVSFTCLDDQLDALNRNFSSSTIDTQDKYNITQNTHKNFLENNKFNGSTINTKKLKKREVADNMNFGTTVFQNDLAQKEIITNFHTAHIAPSRIKEEEYNDFRRKRSIEKEHINDV